jgi:CheY-like chemotaxis protein
MGLIVVAEDDPDNRMLLEIGARRSGHAVVAAASGREALALVRQLCPDLLITDHMMPVMTGAELCRVLAASPVTARIPVLLASGSLDFDNEVRAAELASVVAYLPKPYLPSQVAAAIEAALTGSVAEPGGQPR